MKPLIAVPIGDPAGIGPEIVAKALCEPEVFEKALCIVVGDRKIMGRVPRRAVRGREDHRKQHEASCDPVSC